MPQVKLQGFVGINSDDEYQLVPQPMVTIGENIELDSSTSNQGMSCKPRKGDKFSFKIGNVVAASKKYKLSNVAGPVTIKVTSSNKKITYFQASGNNLVSLNQSLQFGFSLFPNLGFYSNYVPSSITGPHIIIGLNTVLPGNINNVSYHNDFFVLPEDNSDIKIECIEESIPPALTGELRVIGSCDYRGDTFIFSAVTNLSPVSRVSPLVEFDFSQGKWRVLLNSHGLENAEFIILSGASPSISFLNGTHSIEVVDSNSFYLVGITTIPVAPVSQAGLLVSSKIRSVGEIGVMKRDYNGDELYTRLLRSVELNFMTHKQIDVDTEEHIGSIACYFTDYNNSQRVFYYKGEYIEDGALSFVSPDGVYSYDNIDSTLRLIVSTSSLQVRFKEQLQNQGSLKSGNKRYSVRGVGGDLSEYSWSTTTGLIPVFQPELTGSARLVSGNAPDAQCNKSNVLEISGIDPQIISYVDIAIVDYLEDGVEAYIVKRVPVNGRRSFNYTHTGLETGIITIPVASLNIENRPPSKSLNISIADNRLILSNLKYRNEKILLGFFDSVKYRIIQKRIPKIGRLYPDAAPFVQPQDFLSTGEYQDPFNVCYFGTLVPNETYLFAGRVIFKDGFESMPIPFAEIRIDQQSTSSDGRRLSGLPTYNITEGRGGYSIPASTEGEIIVTGIQFSDFDFNYIIDGLPAFQVVDRVEILRAEVSSPSVLYSGIAVLCKKNGTLFSNGQTYDRVEPAIESFSAKTSSVVPLTFIDSAYNKIAPVNRKQDVVALYLPDLIFSGEDALIQAGTKLIVFGSNDYNSFPDYIFGDLFDSPNVRRGYLYYGGDSGWQGQGYSLTEYDIEEAHNVQAGSTYLFNNTQVFFSNLDLTTSNTKWDKNLVLKLSQSIPLEPDFVDDFDPSIGTQITIQDRGIRYVQVYIDQPDKYSNLDNITFISTGYSITSSEFSVDVYGGDAFVQKITHKLAYTGSNIGQANRRFAAIDFYSHTRINAQMRAMAESTISNKEAWPGGYGQDIFSWLFANDYDLNYVSRIYNVRGEVQDRLPYYDGVVTVSEDPTGIIYSDAKIRNAPVDSYRKFSIADYTSIDTKYGPIYHHGLLNGELFTVQERGLQRQYFNTRGVLTTGDGLTALIGDGRAFSRPGVLISQLGSMHKQSVIIGRTQGGNQVLYYFDAVNRHIVRFGSDGTVPISKRAKVSSLIRNNTALAKWSLTPADCFGVHGVWDEVYQEAVWTFRLAKNYKGVWQVGLEIREGDVYSYPGLYYEESFEEIPVLYISQNNHLSKPGTSMLEDLDRWIRVDYGDESYMKFFSIVWSEKDDRFISKDDIYPTIYLKNMDDVYYPRAATPVGDIFKRNAGIPLVFYDSGKGGKEILAAVESVFNIDGNMQKKAVALRVLSALSPYIIEINTNTNRTFIIRDDFVGRLDQWDAPVNKDTQDVDLRKFGEGGIFGTFVRVKFIFNTKEEQRLINMVLKFKPVSRLYTT